MISENVGVCVCVLEGAGSQKFTYISHFIQENRKVQEKTRVSSQCKAANSRFSTKPPVSITHERKCFSNFTAFTTSPIQSLIVSFRTEGVTWFVFIYRCALLLTSDKVSPLPYTLFVIVIKATIRSDF